MTTMTSLAQPPTMPGLSTARRFTTAATKLKTPMRLLPGGDGWSLVGPDGKLVFHALGTQGRRRCLEFAHAQGVLAVFS